MVVVIEALPLEASESDVVGEVPQLVQLVRALASLGFLVSVEA